MGKSKAIETIRFYIAIDLHYQQYRDPFVLVESYVYIHVPTAIGNVNRTEKWDTRTPECRDQTNHGVHNDMTSNTQLTRTVQ